MSIVLAVLVALGTWFVVQDDLKARQLPSFDYATASVTVYAPIERHQRCRKIDGAPVFRDLDPPTD